MKFEEFVLEFTHDKRRFNASCQKAVVKAISADPQIRVAVFQKEKEQPDIFIFYAIDKENKVYWYQGNANYERFSTSIAKALNQKLWAGAVAAKKRNLKP